MNKTRATAMISRNKMKAVDSAPVRPSSSVLAIASGRLATIPEKMISDIPLPMPRCVTCSPSQRRKIVPPVNVTTVVKRKRSPGSDTAEPSWLVAPSSPTAIP
jgi:hypothetical protein